MEDEERLWTNENVNKMALKHFPNINRPEALKRPILYSNWLSKDYVPVDQEELREYVKARLKVRLLVDNINIGIFSDFRIFIIIILKYS